MSFETLKKARTNAMQKLKDAAGKLGESNANKSYDDDRFWSPTLDKAGNGYAVIRFLPAPEGEDLPWTRYWDHGFKGPTGKWYIEKSLTSIGLDDPVGQLNSTLWNSGREKDKEVARTQKRRLHYVTNIMVLQDSANPENEGKIFLYKFGKKIFDKILDLMQPQFQDEEPVNPFDFWEGANFKLKIRQVEGYRNYDKSEFDKQSTLSDNDAKLEKIYKSLHSLTEFTDPSKYKSYAELEAKLRSVLGDSMPMTTAEKVNLDNVQTKPKVKGPAPVEDDPDDVSVSVDDTDDDDLSYFSKLAREED